MKSAIEKIFDGKVSYQKINTSEKFKILLDVHRTSAKEFRETLDEKQVEKFDKLLELRNAMGLEMELQCYKEGIKLGVQLGKEVFE